jgi:hypothetical protein
LDSIAVLTGLHGTEQAVDIALGKRGAGLLTDFDRLVAFAAADAGRVSFDLESAVGTEIGRRVDKLARVESDPRQAIVEAPR